MYVFLIYGNTLLFFILNDWNFNLLEIFEIFDNVAEKIIEFTLNLSESIL